MTVNMLSVVCEIEGDQYVLNIQVPTYILCLYVTFCFIKYIQSYIWCTHTCTCMSTAVINNQDVRYQWRKKKKNVKSCM